MFQKKCAILQILKEQDINWAFCNMYEWISSLQTAFKNGLAQINGTKKSTMT